MISYVYPYKVMYPTCNMYTVCRPLQKQLSWFFIKTAENVYALYLLYNFKRDIFCQEFFIQL